VVADANVTQHAANVLSFVHGRSADTAAAIGARNAAIAGSWRRCILDYSLDPGRHYAPTVLDSRTLKRTTPVHNFTDDFSWTAGSHSLQTGGNFRIVRNRRTNFSGAFDTAYSNPSGYTSG